MQLRRRELLIGERDLMASLTDSTANVAGAEARWSTIGLYRARDGRIADCRLLPLDRPAVDRIRSGAS